ncbi:MAG: chloramphenicol acetyltransferase [Bacteroidales bacterium]|nr:chloramphenicol acetyltransferase [Bacteroidales bacterium]
MCRKAININTWNRKDHFSFYSQFEEPFTGVTVQLDCTQAYEKAKAQNKSFFLYYLYRALKAANSIENFRYRIVGKKIFLYDVIHAGPTIGRDDGSFGFALIKYEEDEKLFYEKALQVVEEVRASTGLDPSVTGEDVIHFSAVPWLDFTSVSHARRFSFPDSCPKITFGKMVEENGRKRMAVSIHVHHGLADGYHVGLFVDRFQDLLDGE